MFISLLSNNNKQTGSLAENFCRLYIEESVFSYEFRKLRRQRTFGWQVFCPRYRNFCEFQNREMSRYNRRRMCCRESDKHVLRWRRNQRKAGESFEWNRETGCHKRNPKRNRKKWHRFAYLTSYSLNDHVFKLPEMANKRSRLFVQFHWRESSTKTNFYAPSWSGLKKIWHDTRPGLTIWNCPWKRCP